MTKAQRRREQRLRAALHALTFVDANGPNDPAGARVPLPGAGVPQFARSDVREVWIEHVFKDPYEHLKHERRANLGG